MNKIAIILFIGALMGCQEVTRPEKPENLIPENTMVDLLTDAYIGNATRSIDNRKLRTQGIFLDSLLYKKFNVDSLQFARSNAYYTSNLNTYAELLKKVEKQLQVRKVIADSLYKIEKETAARERDSLTKQDSLNPEPLIKKEEGSLVTPPQDIEE